jgi:hypothetical protein
MQAIREHLFEKSSLLSRAEWDPEFKILTVFFRSGMPYEYIEVPEEVWDEFTKAESAGKYFHSSIRSKFEHLKKMVRDVAPST